MNRMHPRQIIPILVLLSGTASVFADEPEAGAPPVEQPKQTPSAQTPPNEAAIAAAFKEAAARAEVVLSTGGLGPTDKGWMALARR